MQSKDSRWVVSHPLDEHLMKSVSWASWDVHSGSEELHLTISVEFSYGGWTLLYLTALRAKTSLADWAKSSRGCDLKLWYYKGLLKAVSEKVTSVDAPLLTSRCFCYLDWYWSGHAKTFILPIVVTLVSTCGFSLLLLWRLQPSLFAGRRYCALAHLRQGPVEWHKVLMEAFRSFVQSKWEHSQDLFCVPSCVTHSWQMLMDNCESELLQPTQPEG